jgi:hypothetical protein
LRTNWPKVPALLAKIAIFLGVILILCIKLPIGMFFKGNALPILKSAFLPFVITEPISKFLGAVI